MKECPVCHAKAFDDAEVCYGCLHRYVEEEKPAPLFGEKLLEPAVPEFFIHLVPCQGSSGKVTWSCSVELAKA